MHLKCLGATRQIVLYTDVIQTTSTLQKPQQLLICILWVGILTEDLAQDEL